MQLSSLVLSATALLAHTASGFNIHCPELDRQGYSLATIDHDRETGQNSVGFHVSNRGSSADIKLDFFGRLGDDFVFRWVASGEWLLSLADGTSNPTDITQPFTVGSQTQFLYGGEDGVWNVCDNPELGVYEIILSRTGPIERDGCIGNVALLTVGQ
ncbi:hypothetical protein C8A01DRAFT_38181 [Parachaetomium inaequale]|uniref:Uncharacterized protein n=1 Tax=Parachaetomium inaequale TaxID=2588326 RepID=A0AAN6SNW5_9PEZI|nr:hypothetical protein C8A01DRAFT_38181 [Parachaetomium inaequale]